MKVGCEMPALKGVDGGRIGKRRSARNGDVGFQYGWRYGALTQELKDCRVAGGQIHVLEITLYKYLMA